MTKKIENIIHYNLGQIFTSGINKNFKRGLSILKNSPDFTAKCLTVDKVSRLSPTFNKYIYGNPLPESIDKIGVSKNNFYTGDLIIEIEWFILSIRKYRTEISLFLNYKKDFENYFMLGKYQQALTSIQKIESLLGYSVWSTSAKFLVFEYTISQDKAKLLQSEILEKNKDGVFTSSLISFISQRVERKLSAYRYDSDLNYTTGHIQSKLQQSNKDYYNFQLNFFEHLEFTQLKDVLSFDYCNSIVDRYLTYRRLIIYCVSNGIKIPELIDKMLYVNRRVQDDLFDTIFLFFDPNFKSKSFFDSEYLKIFDLYYSGLYVEVCSEVRAKIANIDVDFNLINIYTRSLVLNNLPFTKLSENPCLVNEIAENIYKIYKKNTNPSEALYSLYQISKNIDSFDLNYQLNTFIKIEQNTKCNKNYFYLVRKKADPIVTEIFKDKPEYIERVIRKITQETYNSIAVNYRYKMLKGDYETIEGIAKNKLEIDKAKELYQKKQMQESLLLWHNIFNNNIDTSPILEVAIDYIFRILSETEKYDDCIKWYVECVIENPFLVFKIDTNPVHKALRKGRFKNVEINIYLPIFISLVSNDENEKSFAIELFCKNKDIKFPSEYFTHLDFEKNEQTELFFFYSCGNETLNYYKHLNTTKKRLNERINICNLLATNFETNSDNYIDELNLLTNELIIHEGTQKLDESKIYANDQAILNKELDEYEGLYNRYITIAGLYLKNIKILTINKNELRYLDKKGEIEYSQNEIEYSESADIDAYYNIFSVIREKFLFSKFGIVTYLSTRIRHGVLLGELRPELEKNNLIFFKNKLKDKYETNSVWLTNTNLTQNDKNKLIQIITDFSSKIDDLINSIIKENIQIKLNNEHEMGWFDYEYSTYELRDNSITLFYEENYKAFCKKVLELLWMRTDENLEEIRKVLQEKIKIQFVQLLNGFDTELHELLGKDKMPEIYTVLNTCSTNIQNKIDKIASWFKRSGKTHIDFQLQMLIGIICKNVIRAHPLKTVDVNFENGFNETIKGEFYEHFSDFIRIFVENMLKHTIGDKINCMIKVYKESENIIMIFENDSISPQSDFPVENFGYGIQVDGLKLITEGKSGLIKARKTIKDDLKNESNDIYFKIDKEIFRVTAIINFTHILA